MCMCTMIQSCINFEIVYSVGGCWLFINHDLLQLIHYVVLLVLIMSFSHLTFDLIDSSNQR